MNSNAPWCLTPLSLVDYQMDMCPLISWLFSHANCGDILSREWIRVNSIFRTVRSLQACLTRHTPCIRSIVPLCLSKDDGQLILDKNCTAASEWGRDMLDNDLLYRVCTQQQIQFLSLLLRTVEMMWMSLLNSSHLLMMVRSGMLLLDWGHSKIRTPPYYMSINVHHDQIFPKCGPPPFFHI